LSLDFSFTEDAMVRMKADVPLFTARIAKPRLDHSDPVFLDPRLDGVNRTTEGASVLLLLPHRTIYLAPQRAFKTSVSCFALALYLIEVAAHGVVLSSVVRDDYITAPLEVKGHFFRWLAAFS